jgi:peptidoglycan/xylan/chitin deacetylase (PgdA/CDA1 family)
VPLAGVSAGYDCGYAARMFDLTLSFDNGADAAVTPAVLDVLARRGLRATFFVLGHRLADPALHRLAERAHAEGHWIGNHTYTHSGPLGRREGPVAEDEIGRTEALIGPLAHPDKLFRPQGGGGVIGPGLLKREVVGHLTAQRYTCVLWNAIPGDWRDPDGWVDTALAQCRAQPWTLMVLHDIDSGAMTHLDRFLGTVADMGGRFRQDFPPDCVPILRGETVRPIERYVSELA